MCPSSGRRPAPRCAAKMSAHSIVRQCAHVAASMLRGRAARSTRPGVAGSDYFNVKSRLSGYLSGNSWEITRLVDVLPAVVPGLYVARSGGLMLRRAAHGSTSMSTFRLPREFGRGVVAVA